MMILGETGEIGKENRGSDVTFLELFSLSSSNQVIKIDTDNDKAIRCFTIYYKTQYYGINKKTLTNTIAFMHHLLPMEQRRTAV